MRQTLDFRSEPRASASVLGGAGGFACVALAFCLCSSAGVVDRIAVVVGDSVITESEVLRELRLTQLINGQAPDLGPEQRRAAAERLVDQQLIRNEMEIGRYPQPSDAEAAAMVRQFSQEHYAGSTQFRAALEKYSITEEELKQHLLWQLAALRFTDQRFHSIVPEAPTQSADRSGPEVKSAFDVDKQMEAWLKETRAGTRIQFKQGAFQ